MEKLENTPKIRLYADRVMVKVLPTKEEATAGGIIIPNVGSEDKKCKYGKVLLMSQDVVKHMESEENEDSMEIGEVVLFSQYAGSEIVIGTTEYRVLRITDCFGVDEDK